MLNWSRPTIEPEIGLSLREAENAIEHVTGVSGGEPVFKCTRVPVRMVAAMITQGAHLEEIVAGYPSLTVRMVEFAEIRTAAHPELARQPGLSDLGATVKCAKRFSLPLPHEKYRKPSNLLTLTRGSKGAQPAGVPRME